MLNRLFVTIGLLVILAIGAAFLVPRFIQWGDYRARLESMAGKAFGAPVAIEGEIHLTLLPQPQLEFTHVRVGPKDAPVMQVARVQAEVSLLDFLQDQYKVTRLELDQPVVNVAIAADGSFASGVGIASDGGQSNVSIDNAEVVDGSVRLSDARSGSTYTAAAINGELKLDAIEGPFSFQGTATLDGAGYGVRVGTGKFAAGSTTLSLYVKPNDASFTLDSSGTVQAGATPKYTGDLTWRQPPPKPKQGEVIDAGRGDLVLTGKIEASAEHALLTSYTLLPDENRATTRLTGAAELKLGKDVSFNAVLSGGLITLPPRDATTELTDPPYELVRLLGETPLPPVPPIPGTIGLDISELNLRAVSLRNLRLDAATDAKDWSITSFAATLPGNTKFGLSGTLNAAEGKPVFAGRVTLDTARLDLLAATWRKPAANDPLFDLPGSLSADVALAGQTLAFSRAKLKLDDVEHGFDAQLNFGHDKQLRLKADFDELSATQSAAVGALLPDLTGGGGGSFGVTFPKGIVNLSAKKATLFGLEGTDLAASASWEGGVVEFSKLSAGDLGGAAFDAKLTAFGTLTKPELSGSGNVKLAAEAPLVKALLATMSTPPQAAALLRLSLPADLNLQLDAPSGDGAQTLRLDGKLAGADAKGEAKLSAGLASALTAPVSATLNLNAATPRIVTAQLGLGDVDLFDARTPLNFSLAVDGTPASKYATQLRLEGGGDHLAFNGDVVTGDFTKLTGEGDLDVKLADPSGLVAALGSGGVYLPAIAGTGHVVFAGFDSVALSQIDANGASGELALNRRGSDVAVSGRLSLPSLDTGGLLPALTGASSTVGSGEGLWPDGPIDIGAVPRGTEGRIDVKVAALTAGGRPLLGDASFGFDWDAQNIKLRDLSGALDKGTLTLDANVCCSNAALPDKQISGRLALSGVPLDRLATGPIAADLDGTINATAEFDGTGESLAQVAAALTGSGSYTIDGFSAGQFDPTVFKTAGTLTGVIDMEPDAITAAVIKALADAPFTAPTVTGSFTIAGGVLRSPNVAINGVGSKTFGGANLSLKDLMVDARYAMTPTDPLDPSSLIDPTTAEVAAVIKGPLWAPNASYDVASLVDGMKIKASEIELAVLEQRRAEDEARQKAAADEQARVAAEQAAAAKKAADDAALQKAADDAAAAARAASSSSSAARDLGL